MDAMRDLAELKRRAFRVTTEEIMVTSSGRRTFQVSYLRKSGEAVSFEVEATNPDTAVGIAVTQASGNEGHFVENLTFDDSTAQGLYKSLCASVAVGRPEGHLRGRDIIDYRPS